MGKDSEELRRSPRRKVLGVHEEVDQSEAESSSITFTTDEQGGEQRLQKKVPQELN